MVFKRIFICKLWINLKKARLENKLLLAESFMAFHSKANQSKFILKYEIFFFKFLFIVYQKTNRILMLETLIK